MHNEPFSRFTPKLVSERRMCDAVDVMLTLQNPNGGFASYELVRGPRWLEWLNPAEVFGWFPLLPSQFGSLTPVLGNIMTEYCYPECTTSVITSLSIFRKYYPHYRADDIESVLPFHYTEILLKFRVVQSNTPPRNRVSSRRSDARRRVVGLLGYLFYLCYPVCNRKSLFGRRNI